VSFVPHTQADKDAMLQAIGVSSIDALFDDIPENLRIKGLDLPIGVSEVEALDTIDRLADCNTTTKNDWFVSARGILLLISLL